MLDFANKFFTYFLWFLLFVFVLFFVYLLFSFLTFYIKQYRIYKKSTSKKRKFTFKRFKVLFIQRPTGSFILDFLKLIFYDILRGKDTFKLFGIWAFTGYYGQGKTLGMVVQANRIKKLYPHKNIKIYANFEVKGQDGYIYKVEDLLNLPKNTIVLFDEIQGTFSSTNWKDFPIDLLATLTQCRKRGLAIFCTTPVYSRMSIQLRESVDYVITSTNKFNLDRWFKYIYFRADKYESYENSSDFKKLFTNSEFTQNVIAHNSDYDLYDTSNIVKRLDIKNK